MKNDMFLLLGILLLKYTFDTLYSNECDDGKWFLYGTYAMWNT